MITIRLRLLFMKWLPAIYSTCNNDLPALIITILELDSLIHLEASAQKHLGLNIAFARLMLRG
jgi:hypothetical protein